MEKFIEKLAASLRDSTMVKATLSKPLERNNPLRNICQAYNIEKQEDVSVLVSL